MVNILVHVSINQTVCPCIFRAMFMLNKYLKGYIYIILLITVSCVNDFTL